MCIVGLEAPRLCWRAMDSLLCGKRTLQTLHMPSWKNHWCNLLPDLEHPPLYNSNTLSCMTLLSC